MENMCLTHDECMPYVFTFSGKKFEETKKSSPEELCLRIDSQLRNLCKKYDWAEMTCSVKAVEKNKCIPIKIFIVVNFCGPIELIKLSTEIEKILWSYNSHVQVAESGAFSTVFQRLEYKVTYNFKSKKAKREA